MRTSQSPMALLCGSWLLAALLMFVGCSHHNYDVANPVVGPAPPRIPQMHTALVQSEDGEGEIEQVNFEAQTPLPATAIAARVNGQPILVGTVLEQYSPQMAQFESKLDAAQAQGAIDAAGRDAQIRKLQQMLLKRDLPRIVEQTLMASAVKAKLKKEQLAGIEEQLDKEFVHEIENMKQELKVNSPAEVEAALQQHGMSLESMRKTFGDRILAGEYVKAKIGKDRVVTRQELLDDYHAHLEDYARPEQVQWQQLQVSITNERSEADSLKMIDRALAELRAGADFADVVKKYSDGPLKENGGNWDWMQPSSVASADVRHALETLPVGEISPVISSPTSLQLIRVTQRRVAGHLPFEEVQEKIRKRLIEESRNERAQAVIEELKAGAIVETLFDNASDPAETAAP